MNDPDRHVKPRHSRAVIGALAAFALLVALMLGLLGFVLLSGSGDRLTPEAKGNFLRSCENQPQATPDRCRCLWEVVESRLSPDELIRLGQEVERGGSLPPGLVDEFRDRCAT